LATKSVAHEHSLDLSGIVDRFHCGHAAEVMGEWPDGFVDLIVTSPPYWTAVEYEDQGQSWASYEDYLADMMAVWRQCARVLRPNGKLCINAPVMPVPKAMIEQHTRHIKNIAFDFDNGIIASTDLERYSVFIWQKQTSKLMFGSYPFPGNLLENNTIEFINVYVKPGKPPKFDPEVKEANRLSRAEWIDLIQQVWFMYPEDVKREEGHPAPFPIKLPARLMRLYTYGAYREFPGEIVLDPFVGTGTTCTVATSMGRQWIGIDISKTYLDYAEEAVTHARPYEPLLIVGRPKYPSKDELIQILSEENGSAGPDAEKKHKRKTYGRGVSKRDTAHPRLL
jgi:DNA modification methylase